MKWDTYEYKKGSQYGKRLFVEAVELIQEEDDEDYEGEPVYDEEIVNGDEAPLLVVRSVCLTPRSSEGDDWLRNNIFQYTCTIEGKVCKLVIDSGSCENVVSEEAVKKLSLKTKTHPNLYKLKKDGEISVTQRSLVPFSIGAKYKDKAWCDVITMDAFHLLLGRPWQFDRHVVHDGKHNTYSFMMNNNKIILIPSKDVSPKPPPPPSKKNLLAQKEFMSEAVENGVTYILMVKTSVAKHEAQEEYVDVFPKELPKELPPLSGI
ncbi:hypothetical protein LIER_04352 [Lithospermum erythrorhizon]|uniref:Gag-pol polyprotein n=1 Tax=Lithospermum erythrorhizon TaxID=34254 RepID=A0AAV3P149_LITER